MTIANDAVDSHYSIGGIYDSITEALQVSGVDLNNVSSDDLSPVDEFHTRGLESTIELAQKAGFQANHRILDVGCGLGGSVRHLAESFGSSVTGLDVSREYVEAATKLADLVGLGDKVSFKHGSALELPFEDGSFDRVWTEHAQMNIADKGRFYAEISRVLAPGGSLLFNDIFLGTEGTPHYPAPWAATEDISSLVPQSEARTAIEAAGLNVASWEDKTDFTLVWFQDQMANMQAAGGPQPVGLHLLMGSTGKEKIQNMIRNMAEKRVSVALGVAEK